jgi:hypothetical protein
MNAEEFYNNLDVKKAFTKLTSTGITDNLENVFEFAEAYYKSKVSELDCKHLNIDVEGGVGGGYYCTDCREQFESLDDVKR